MTLPKKRNHYVQVFIALAFIMMGAGIGVTFGVQHYYLYPESPTRYTDIAQIGDFIGGVSAPFLAIAGSLLVYAAFRRQAIDADQSAENQIRQEFESTFLQMLLLLREVRREITEDNKNYFSELTENLQSVKQDTEALKNHFINHILKYQRDKTEHYIAHITHITDYLLGFSTEKHTEYHISDKIRLLSLQFTHNELFYIHLHLSIMDAGTARKLEGNGFFERLTDTEKLL